jgi:hypothetical protein
VGVDHARDRDPAARELLDDHRVGRQIEPHAAVLFGDRHPEQAELLHLLDDRLGEGVLVVVVLGVGQDLLVGELMHHLGDRLLLVGLLGVRLGGHGHSLSAPGRCPVRPFGSLTRENTGVNFAATSSTAGPAGARAGRARARRLAARVELRRGGERSARLAGALRRAGVGRGDVVMTLIGNRPEWVLSMSRAFASARSCCPAPSSCAPRTCACAWPSRARADHRRRAQPRRARGGGCGRNLRRAARARRDACSPPSRRPRRAGGDRPLPDHLHERHRRRAEGGGARPALPLRPAPAGRALAGRARRASSCGARPRAGWSKSARNVFIAPWLSGAAALLHDARFDPAERLELLARERVNVLCMAPTEYRVIAKRATLRRCRRLRGMVAAGEALNPEVLRAFKEATGLEIRDGYGQTETGQLTGMPPGRAGGPARWAGAAGVGCRSRTASWSPTPRACRRSSSATSARASTRPDGRPGGSMIAAARALATGRSGQRRRGRLAVLRGARRRRDRLGRLPDRAVRGRVRARRPPRRRRGRGRGRARRGARGGRARGGRAARRRLLPSPELARELQEHVKRETAPYKYPRIVDFVAELPKTASGKVRRAALRSER